MSKTNMDIVAYWAIHDVYWDDINSFIELAVDWAVSSAVHSALSVHSNSVYMAIRREIYE